MTARSADGTVVHGQADVPSAEARTAVIFVPGTGLFDRDGGFGTGAGARDLVFKDLAARMNARGLATVRFDLRGVRHGASGTGRLDHRALGARTTTTMRDDLRAVYEWTRAPAGLGARCAILLAHSEGMVHVARMAEAGAPAPLAVIGIGAPMASPQATLRWQIAEREAYSLELMDEDRNGVTIEAEVRANIGKTPVAVFGVVDPFLTPGGWSAVQLALLRASKTGWYERTKADALASADAAPYPDVANAFASFEWWKSWYTDDRSVADRLAAWGGPVRLHYGTRDSQVHAPSQQAALAASPLRTRAAVTLHADKGHTLGAHVLLGPMDERIADAIADQAAVEARRCPAR